MAKFEDLIKKSSMAHWSLTGRSQLVKVVSASGYDYSIAAGAVGGYVTEQRFLWGLTSLEIEAVLGLRQHELSHIAYIFALARLPTSDEVDFHLSAALPGGTSAFDGKGDVTPTYAAGKAKAEAAFAAGRGSMDRSYWPVVDFYPIGSNMVPQWRIRDGVRLPIQGLLGIASPHQPFARDNGSTKPYTPHNRGPIRL